MNRDDYIIFRDERLEGDFPYFEKFISNIYELNEYVSVHTAFAYLNAAARRRNGKVKTLTIMCHGYEKAVEEEIYGLKVPVEVNGGLGLQLGMEEVKAANVGGWSTIKDKTEKIIVYACGAAGEQPGVRNTDGDGKYLMSQLAKATNADVFAADSTQWYFRSGMDFGSWEGNLYRFKPDGSFAKVPFNWRVLAN